MSKLRIKNFGAIKEADIEVKKINICIGYTSSGKSTVAKLLAIFNSIELLSLPNGGFSDFCRLLTVYCIDFTFHSDTELFYEQEKYYWRIKKDLFETNNQEDAFLLQHVSDLNVLIDALKERKDNLASYHTLFQNITSLKNVYPKAEGVPDYIISNLVKLFIKSTHKYREPVYLPAERLLVTSLSNKIFTYLNEGVSIPDCVTRFGALYERAKTEQKNISIHILGIKASFSKEKEDEISISGTGEVLKLKQASSGIQSVLPLWTVLNHKLRPGGNRSLILLEEPELNLYPTVQIDFMNWVMTKMRKSQSNLVITTHSPYILTAIDDLIMGGDVYTGHKGEKEVIRKLASILPIQALINFDDVASYYFDGNGYVKDICDKDTRSVGAEYLDDASERTSYIYNELCNLL